MDEQQNQESDEMGRQLACAVAGENENSLLKKKRTKRFVKPNAAMSNISSSSEKDDDVICQSLLHILEEDFVFPNQSEAITLLVELVRNVLNPSERLKDMDPASLEQNIVHQMTNTLSTMPLNDLSEDSHLSEDSLSPEKDSSFAKKPKRTTSREVVRQSAAANSKTMLSKLNMDILEMFPDSEDFLRQLEVVYRKYVTS
jgi:hypothetical protein